MKTKKASKVIKLIVLKEEKKKRNLKRPYVNPRQLKNFIFDNALQDWLEKYSEESPEIARTHISLHTDFKKHVHQALEKAVGDTVYLADPEGTLDPAKMNGAETLEHMKRGTVAIFNAVLIDRSSGVYDVADLLIRSDYISTAFTDAPEHALESSSCKFGPWNYVCVGISFSRNQLTADGTRMLNTNSVRYKKTRLYMQNLVLDKYQNLWCNYALMIGNGFRWKRSVGLGGGTEVSNNFLTRPALVTFDDKDNFVTATYEAGKSWLKDLSHSSSKSWSLTRPPRKELYANAKLSIYDTPWAAKIQKIAEDQDDITRLWKCTVSHRAKAHQQGVFRLSQAKRPEDIGHRSTTKTGTHIGKFLKMLSKDSSALSSCIGDLSLPADVVVLDFEYLANGKVLYRGRTADAVGYVYLACLDEKIYGMGINSLEDNERKLALDLYADLQQLIRDRPNVKICCWSEAEVDYMYKLEEKYPEAPLGSTFSEYIFDLHYQLVSNNIVLPKMYNYSLARVAQCLSLPNKTPINTNKLALQYFQDGDTAARDRLIEYNRNDCTVLRGIYDKLSKSGRTG